MILARQDIIARTKAATDTSALPVDELRELLTLEAGQLIWRKREAEWFTCTKRRPADVARSWNAKFAGKPVSLVFCRKGYARFGILGRRYLAHRVIWALSYHEWPFGELDHIDGNPKNNAIGNLRAVSTTANARNTRRRRDNTSGRAGVYWVKRRKCWLAQISVAGRARHIGHFKTFDAAVAARAAAEAEHGFSHRHGQEPAWEDC